MPFTDPHPLRLTLVSVFAAAASLSSAGCSVYDARLLDIDAAEVPDAPSPMDAPLMFASRQPPPRPPIPDDDIFIGQRTFALRDSLLNQGIMWRQIGYDLDGVQTAGATGFMTQCHPQSGDNPQTDGIDGVDNTFGSALFPLVNGVVRGLQETAQQAQMQGMGMPVLRLSEWNGLANDSRVDVAVTTAVLSTSADGIGSAPPVVNIVNPRLMLLENGMEAPGPAWDGMDWTWVRSDTFGGNDLARPAIQDDNAYVANNQLVVRLPTLELTFPAESVGVAVSLSQAIIVGTLTQDGGLADVTVTGRWSVAALLSTAEAVGLCIGSDQYILLETNLDRLADIRRVPPEPGEANLTCDAISVAVTFQGFPIRIASLTTGLAIVNQCASMGDAGVDGGGSDAGVDAFSGFDAPDAFTPTPDAFSPDTRADAR